MKTRILIFLLCLASLNVMGQGTITRQSTRKTEQAGEKTPVKKQTSNEQKQNSRKTSGTLNGHEWVDLGLPSGTRWATCNVGANKPSEYGDFYAWGETSTKLSYDWDNLKYHTSGNSKDNIRFAKYVTNSKYGTVDGKSELDPSDDAANANWGKGWRMPSLNQVKELIEKCKWVWASINDHYGFTVVGPNGNSIFLPFAGCRDGNSSDMFMSGMYWSRTLYTGDSYRAFFFAFDSEEDGAHTYEGARRFGYPVRAVTE